jgi:hypothetical protein
LFRAQAANDGRHGKRREALYISFYPKAAKSVVVNKDIALKPKLNRMFPANKRTKDMATSDCDILCLDALRLASCRLWNENTRYKAAI